MITVRQGDSRGASRLSWLDSRHTFSFGEYHDPRQMGFGALRVINEDRVIPSAGFPMHGHRDMEIISYVLSGALEHEDSLGNGSVILPGEVQRMSAGTGIRHSEYNASKTDPTHFLQIWVVPDTKGLVPGYEQRTLSREETDGRFALIGAPGGGQGAITIHQDVRLYLARLDAREHAAHILAPGRRAWLQIARGHIRVADITLEAGDGAALTDIREVAVIADTAAEVLLFDLA